MLPSDGAAVVESSLTAAASAQAVPSPPLVSTELMTTNAVNRSLSNLHAPTWLALLTLNITGRTLIFHPLQLSIARKRVTRAERPPTVPALLRAAYKGGLHSFPVGPGGSAASVDEFKLGRGGLRGCYRGVGAALFSNLVGEMSYLVMLEVLKERFASHSPPASAGGSVASGDAAVRRGDRATSTSRLSDGSSSGAVDEDDDGEGEKEKEADFTADSLSAAVGAMAGDLVALLLVTPSVVVANRQMTAGCGMAAANAYRSAVSTLREVWALYPSRSTWASAAWWSNGLRGVYQGATAGLLRIPSSGCWWALYTKTKEGVYTIAAPTLSRWEQQRTLAEGPNAPPPSVWRRNWLLSPTDNPLLNALAGTFASISTTVLFNPIAVVQTRQQTLPREFWREFEERQRAAVLGSRRTRAWAALRRGIPFQRVCYVAADLVRTEGVAAFFKGASANVGVAVFDGVLFSLLFEFSKLGSDTQFLQQFYSST